MVFAIAPAHTQVLFDVVQGENLFVQGKFPRIHGMLARDSALGVGTADIRLDTQSITSGAAPVDAMLKSEDFFHTQRYPDARFQAPYFAWPADHRVEWIDGQLTLRGRTLPVRLRATRFSCLPSPPMARDTCSGELETTIQRRDWGMGAYDFIPNNVRLRIRFLAIHTAD